MNIHINKNGDLYCNAVHYNHIVTRNLITDNSAADLSNTWAPVTRQDKVGYKCYRCFKVSKSVSIQSLFDFIAGHKYYIACHYQSNAPDNVFLGLRTGSTDLINIYKGATYTDTANDLWTLASAIWKCPQNYSSANVAMKKDDDSKTTYVCKWILVDLTKNFGVGKEPTKEWCDNNIREHEVLQNFGCVSSAVSKTTYKSDSGTAAGNGVISFVWYPWHYFNDSATALVFPRSYIYQIYLQPGRTESYMWYNTNLKLSNTSKYYFQAYLLYKETVDNAHSIAKPLYNDTQCYWPVAEPNMGTVYHVTGTKFNGGGECVNWQKAGFFAARNNWASGSYPLRFDFDGKNEYYIVAMTGLQLTSVSAVVKWGNSMCKLSLDDSLVNQEWCDRWIEGRSSPFVHIKNPHNTKITLLNGRPNDNEIIYGDISCNDINIDHRATKVSFDKTGTITCRRLIKDAQY